MNSNRNLDALLRSMDAAGKSPAPAMNRAQKDLERILRTHPMAATTDQQLPAPGNARPAPSRRRRTVILGAVALAATAGFLVVPAFYGGDPAFATWTAAPGELAGADRDNAVSDCTRSSQRVGSGMYKDELASAAVAIAERRGAWTTIVLIGSGGFTATCTTDSTAPWFKKGSFGSVGNSEAGQAPAAQDIRATQLGTGVISDNALSMASGQVGSEVTAVTYTKADGERVKATVSKGQFALWFPGAEISNSSGQAVPVEVTYSDGTSAIRHLSL